MRGALSYRTHLHAHLHEGWSRWFDRTAIENAPDGTNALVGPLQEQTALHGLLAKVRDLGLVLFSIESYESREVQEMGRAPDYSKEVVAMDSQHTGQTGTRVLLVGYSGANNTGSEALLLADIEDMQAVFGPSALITIPTINPANLRRYVQETPGVHIAPMSTLVFPALRKMIKESDIVFLVEGSTYMDTWTSVMLWAYLGATHWANEFDKPCAAYAVDAGQIKSSLNRRLMRSQVNETDLIIARAGAAAERLRSLGVKVPIEVTADNAFTFVPDPADAGLLSRLWPEGGDRIVGLALVDFNLFPVVMRPWGAKEECYKWPYYFHPDHDKATEELIASYAALADHLAAEHGVSVALICMEELDERIARKIYARMAHAGRARIFSSGEYTASKMVSILRGLDFLVTARYHACVLSMAAQVPQIAVGHDLRLKTMYTELGLQDNFVDAHSPDRDARLRAVLDRVLADPEPVRAALRRGYDEHLNKARCNREILRQFAVTQLGSAALTGAEAARAPSRG